MNLQNIILIGDENVGKSTLWNAIIGHKKALVSHVKGTTRDCLSETIYLNNNKFVISDLPGHRLSINNEQDRKINELIDSHIKKASLVYIVVDSRYALPSWLYWLIKNNFVPNKCPIIIIKTHKDLNVNADKDIISAENLYFASDIIKKQLSVNTNKVTFKFINDLLESTLSYLNKTTESPLEQEEKKIPKVAIVGRPNSGKSTLINYLAGSERLIASELPGTTTDSISVPITYRGNQYLFIDTAGYRRKQGNKDVLEKIATCDGYLLPIVQECDILVLLCDGSENFTKQDIFLMNYAFNKVKRSTLLVINKMDSHYFKNNKSFMYDKAYKVCDALKQERLLTISAKRGTGIKKLMSIIKNMYADINLQTKIPPRKVTFYLQQINSHKKHKNVKLKFAQVTNWNPCRILIHGTNIHNVDSNYKRFLVNSFRSKLNIHNMPIRLIFKNG